MVVHNPLTKTVISTIAKPLQIAKSRLRKIARYLEDKPVLALALQNEVDECMAFGDSDRGPRSRDTPINNGGAGEAGKQLH